MKNLINKKAIEYILQIGDGKSFIQFLIAGILIWINFILFFLLFTAFAFLSIPLITLRVFIFVLVIDIGLYLYACKQVKDK